MLLSFAESKKLLRKYGILVKDAELTHSLKECSVFAKKTGFPVVLKISSLKVIHKTEQKAVIANILNEKMLKESFNDLNERFKEKEGIIIQKQFSGHEIVIGIKNDPTFGKVIMVGMGGIFVEVLKDVSFRLCPIDKIKAKEMIKELKGYEILKGYRGGKEINFDKLAELLANLSKLAASEDISEIDFNPVFVSDKINIADIRIVYE